VPKSSKLFACPRDVEEALTEGDLLDVAARKKIMAVLDKLYAH
jgi:hypothetical protein